MCSSLICLDNSQEEVTENLLLKKRTPSQKNQTRTWSRTQWIFLSSYKTIQHLLNGLIQAMPLLRLKSSRLYGKITGRHGSTPYINRGSSQLSGRPTLTFLLKTTWKPGTRTRYGIDLPVARWRPILYLLETGRRRWLRPVKPGSKSSKGSSQDTSSGKGRLFNSLIYQIADLVLELLYNNLNYKALINNPGQINNIVQSLQCST